MGRPVKATPKRIKFVMEQYSKNQKLEPKELKVMVDKAYSGGRGFSLANVVDCMKLVIMGFEPAEMTFPEFRETLSQLPGGGIQDIKKVAALVKDSFSANNSCKIRTMRKAEKKEDLRAGTQPMGEAIPKEFYDCAKTLPPLMKAFHISQAVFTFNGTNFMLKTQKIREDTVPMV